MEIKKLAEYIAPVKDFPKPGIDFKDITPLMQNGDAFATAIEKMYEFAKANGATIICGPEARGFIFGCPVAYKLNIGFVPVRKPGKLPRKTLDMAYSLEYGTNTLSIHADAIKPGDKVVIVDDLLATGGTVKCTIDMIEKLGGQVVGCCFLIELKDLKGRELLKNYKTFTLLEY